MLRSKIHQSQNDKMAEGLRKSNRQRSAPKQLYEELASLSGQTEHDELYAEETEKPKRTKKDRQLYDCRLVEVDRERNRI